MGDPRKIRAKTTTPLHPWKKERIDEEAKLVKEYGIPRKRELWRMGTILSDAKKQVKRLAEQSGDQVQKEEQQLMQKLKKLGLLQEGSTFQSILGLELRDLLERRLQTIIVKKELARSIKQARQFITHGHIFVKDTKVTAPSFLVDVESETQISFDPRSAINNPDHPERIPKEKLAKEKKKKEELTKESKIKEKVVQKKKEDEKKESDAKEEKVKEAAKDAPKPEVSGTANAGKKK